MSIVFMTLFRHSIHKNKHLVDVNHCFPLYLSVNFIAKFHLLPLIHRFHFKLEIITPQSLKMTIIYVCDFLLPEKKLYYYFTQGVSIIHGSYVMVETGHVTVIYCIGMYG